MTGRERILAMLAGQKVDSFPCMPITMMFAADILGTTYGEHIADHKIMADAQVKTAESFGLDYVSVIGPAPETFDLGSQVQWYDDQPPAVIEEQALFADKSALASVSARNPPLGRWMEDRLLGVELLRKRAGRELLVEGWVEGPCAEAAELRGVNRLMVDFFDDPAFVRDLLDFTLELETRFALAQIDSGADVIGIGDAVASLVGPRIYREQVWPWEKKLVDAIHAGGGRVRLHICGNTSKILDEIARLGCDMVDIDFPVRIQEARSKLGPGQTLTGNLDPIRNLRNGSAETIMQSLQVLAQQAGSLWIVAAGCEIVRDTPHINLRAMVDFARRHAPDIAAGQADRSGADPCLLAVDPRTTVSAAIV